MARVAPLSENAVYLSFTTSITLKNGCDTPASS